MWAVVRCAGRRSAQVLEGVGGARERSVLPRCGAAGRVGTGRRRRVRRTKTAKANKTTNRKASPQPGRWPDRSRLPNDGLGTRARRSTAAPSSSSGRTTDSGRADAIRSTGGLTSSVDAAPAEEPCGATGRGRAVWSDPAPRPTSPTRQASGSSHHHLERSREFMAPGPPWLRSRDDRRGGPSSPSAPAPGAPGRRRHRDRHRRARHR